MPDNEPRQYMPSNGTEGVMFTDHFCMHCVHGKSEHCEFAEPCDILMTSYMDGGAKEWLYDDQGRPTCTAHVPFEWVKDEEGNFIDPPPPPNPNQLTLNFEL